MVYKYLQLEANVIVITFLYYSVSGRGRTKCSCVITLLSFSISSNHGDTTYEEEINLSVYGLNCLYLNNHHWAWCFSLSCDCPGEINAHTQTASSNRYCLLVVLHTCTQSTSTQPLREQTTRNTYFQVVRLIKATKTILFPWKNNFDCSTKWKRYKTKLLITGKMN